ncbi:MAG: hypothetical protein ACE5GB_05395 [Acidimicrobiales bacterium]
MHATATCTGTCHDHGDGTNRDVEATHGTWSVAGVASQQPRPSDPDHHGRLAGHLDPEDEQMFASPARALL